MLYQPILNIGDNKTKLTKYYITETRTLGQSSVHIPGPPYSGPLMHIGIFQQQFKCEGDTNYNYWLAITHSIPTPDSPFRPFLYPIGSYTPILSAVPAFAHYLCCMQPVDFWLLRLHKN